MTLITRISRLFKADLHGILDVIEEPEPVLKQAVRDMQEELEKAEQELSAKKRRREEIQAAAEQCQRELHEMEERIDICFAAQNEELARSAVRKKLELVQQQKASQQAASALSVQVDELSARVEDYQDKLREIEQKIKAFSSSHEAWTDSRENRGLNTAQSAVTEQDVELALLEEKMRRRSHSAQRDNM